LLLVKLLEVVTDVNCVNCGHYLNSFSLHTSHWPLDTGHWILIQWVINNNYFFFIKYSDIIKEYKPKGYLFALHKNKKSL
jgi:hypothetical protein